MSETGSTGDRTSSGGVADISMPDRIFQTAYKLEGHHEAQLEFVNVATSLQGLVSRNGRPDYIELILGQAQLFSSPAQVLEHVQSDGASDTVELTVHVKGRFALSRDRAEELAEVLLLAVQQHDAAVAQRAPDTSASFDG